MGRRVRASPGDPAFWAAAHFPDSRQPLPYPLYYDTGVALVGAKNSAPIAALELYRSGAHVRVIHRGQGIGAAVKYSIKPDIESRIQRGEIRALFHSAAREIRNA